MNHGVTYDVLIVGAGSAGAILAARLSERESRSVILLEAGPDYRSTDTPREMRSPNPLGITNPDRFAPYQWPNLLVQRTPVQEPRLYDRGRGMGGSSSINWQVAHRGMLEDYDNWADQGCWGWSGEELLPAMNQIETDLDFGDAPYHGNRGPITVYRPPISQWGKVDQALLEAGLDFGHPWHPDLNAPDSTGISTAPVNRSIDNRVSTNDAYLEPARQRKNLTIAGDSQVDRVLFNENAAVGVRVIRDGVCSDIFARQIILAAGSVFTPPVLLRSGIGPANHLKELGVEVRKDLPVGKNLSDHASVGIQLKLKPFARAASWDDRLLTCYIRYSSGLAGAGKNDMVLASRNLNGYDQAGLDAGAMSVILWQAFSRGRLTLADKDPFSMPVIQENLLSDERDIVRLREGAKQLFQIARHPATFAISEHVSLGKGVTGSFDKSIDDLTDDDAIDEWMMATVRDTWHLVGTCRMGAQDDSRTVVDSDCRILGIENLRVIDGSIMPDVPRANTNLTCMTIAEHMVSRLNRQL